MTVPGGRSSREARILEVPDNEGRATQPDLGRGQMIGVGTGVQRSDQSGDVGRGPGPVDAAGSCRTFVPRVVSTAFGVLPPGPGGAVLQFRQQLVEAGNRCLVTLGVQGERGFFGGDRKPHLLENVPLVHPLGHEVPRDAVLSFLVQEGPRRDVQPCVFGKKSVVEVDGLAARQGEHIRMNNGEMCDAKEVVEGFRRQASRQVTIRRDAGDAVLLSPSLHLRIVRDDLAHDMPACSEAFGTLNQQGLAADEHAAEVPRMGHALLPCLLPSRHKKVPI